MKETKLSRFKKQKKEVIFINDLHDMQLAFLANDIFWHFRGWQFLIVRNIERKMSTQEIIPLLEH